MLVMKVFSDCIISKGKVRSIICDLTRRRYHFIPNDLADFMLENEGLSKSIIIDRYGSDNSTAIIEYFIFLEENEFIFWCEDSNFTCFPKIDLQWHSPFLINNLIIDLNNYSKFSVKDILFQADKLNCQHVQIRNFSQETIGFFSDELIFVEDSKFKSIEIITKYYHGITRQDVKEFLSRNLRVTLIVFYSAPTLEVYYGEKLNGNFVFLKEQIFDSNHCGQIHWNYFNVNIKLFTEAQHHNTCLNRKISIDVNGEIKNCPSMSKSFGNIKDTTLAEAIEKPGFKDLWDINKDKIHVCKDCEFRYICTDCRAYIENPEDIYSKPLKCGYNPYTAEWEEWSTNPLKQKAIEYYGMQDLIKPTQ